jgi:hypothetical protein
MISASLGLLWDINGNKFAGCDGKMVVGKFEYDGFRQLSFWTAAFLFAEVPLSFPWTGNDSGQNLAAVVMGSQGRIRQTV